MKVLHDGRTAWGELSAFARWAWRSIHPEIKYGPPGEKLNIISTSDFDSQGKLKDAARKRIEELAKAKKR